MTGEMADERERMLRSETAWIIINSPEKRRLSGLDHPPISRLLQLAEDHYVGVNTATKEASC